MTAKKLGFWALIIALLMVSQGLRADDPTTSGSSVRLPHIIAFNKYKDVGYSDSWGYTAPDGREYALVGVQNGTAVVDITDAGHVKEISFIPGVHSMWKEIKTFGSFAYVATDSAAPGLQVIDLSKLPEVATLAYTNTELGSLHDIWVDEKAALLYGCGGSSQGVTIYSLADPSKPKVLTSFDKGTYTHDMWVGGGRAFLSHIMSKSFSVWDVSNPGTPKMLKRFRLPSAPSISFHNAWPTKDGNYLITTEETSGRTVKFWDIRDLNNITMVAEYLGTGNLAHNVYIKGDYAYISHYGGGLKIVDIKDPTHPKEVANWDKDDQTPSGFSGAWGAYPFFKSGKVIISDMEDGLFVVQFDGAKE